MIKFKLDDINLNVGFLVCRDGQRERTIPFGKRASKALDEYLNQARGELLKGQESDWLFTNCNGKAMTRQGFWKIIKYYGEKAGIQAHITSIPCVIPLTLTLLGSGADIQARQCLGIRIWRRHRCMLLTGFPVDMYHKKDQEKKLDRIVPILLLSFLSVQVWKSRNGYLPSLIITSI